jgi:hypothetical protein
MPRLRHANEGVVPPALRLIKAIHTIIWAVMAAACLYVLYAGIMQLKSPLVWVCIGLILVEGIVLLINRGTCPLTPLARKHTTDTKENFDIYLPEWLAKHNKTIFTSIFVAGLLLVIFR